MLLIFPLRPPFPPHYFLQALSRKEVEPFTEEEHNHPNKKRARKGEERKDAQNVGEGDLAAGRAKRDKIMLQLLGKTF